MSTKKTAEQNFERSPFSTTGILAKVSLPNCALRLESRHQHTRMHASLHRRSLQTINSGYTRTATQLLTPQYNVNPTRCTADTHFKAANVYYYYTS
jgi:hypothetical protein